MSRRTERDLYRGRDPREIPAYDSFTASRYLRIPEQTIRNWAFGYEYATRTRGRAVTAPLIKVADPQGLFFSFSNLIELHVLGALRRDHRVEMKKIRRAVEWLRDKLGSARPLLEESLETDDTDVFVTKLGQLINASKHGQLAMHGVLQAYLKRIDRDAHGVPVRLFPFTWSPSPNQALENVPKMVAIDPAVAFGRPVIVGSRVPTIEVFERFTLGEQPDELAEDFGVTPGQILEAIRCESAAA